MLQVLIPYLVTGLAAVFISALLSQFIFKPRQLAKEPAPEPVQEGQNVNRKVEKRLQEFDKRLNDLDRRLSKIENEASQRIAEKKIDAIRKEIEALESRRVDPLQHDLDALRSQIAELKKAPASEGYPAPVDQIIPVIEAPPDPAPESEPQPAPSDPVEWKPIPEASTVPEQKLDSRSPGDIIVDSFDDVDAQSMRKLDRMKQEYQRRLGSALADLYERDGAYVFVMKDKTAYVHPKPNSPLPRVWERAFLGATSYSRPIQRVHRAALVRKADGEYEVIETGEFQVL